MGRMVGSDGLLLLFLLLCVCCCCFVCLFGTLAFLCFVHFVNRSSLLRMFSIVFQAGGFQLLAMAVLCVYAMYAYMEKGRGEV